MMLNLVLVVAIGYWLGLLVFKSFVMENSPN